MPMIDAFIPEGALARAAEELLIKELTDILLRHEEGLEPSNERAQAVSVVFLHRPKVFVAGREAERPRYRFISSVPEGQYASDEVRRSLVRQVTEAVARAEGAPFEDVSPRVWVFPNEIADGLWGARGEIRRLPDILRALVDEDAARQAEERLARLRRRAALALLDAAHRGDETAGGAGKKT